MIPLRSVSLQAKMLIGFLVGLILGLVVNVTQHDAGWVAVFTTYVTVPIGQIFLRLLFMLVLPLLFSALVISIVDMGNLHSLRRVGIKALLLTVSLSLVAVLIALAVTSAFRPGDGVDPAQAHQTLTSARDGASAVLASASDRPIGAASFLDIIPTNVVTAAAHNDILAVMFFALAFGIGLLLVDTPSADRLKEAIEGIFQVTMRLIGIFIRMAPLAIACFMFNLTAVLGWTMLLRLGAYVGVVLVALGLQMFVIYPLALRLLAGASPIAFFRGVQEVAVVAFSSASSNVALPTALRIAEEDLRLVPRVSRFVLTIGTTANQHGTAIFEGVTILFLAQFFSVELSLSQQVSVTLICLLGGIGTAGVPAGALPMIVLMLAMVGVPAEGIGLILGVDRFLDMCRTTLNVVGDLVVATIISRGEIADLDSACRTEVVVSQV